MRPLVSWICPTDNLPPRLTHLLEEVVESFARQDYRNRELVILNSTPGQTLVCDYPGVRVVNVAHRYPTLGDKLNALVELSRGDILLPCDHDDISLPWRTSQAVERLGAAHYWNPQRTWFMDGGGLHCDHAHGVCHNGSAFTRRGWQIVGGYPRTTGAQDAQMDALLKSLGAVPSPLSADPSSWSYIYRWGVSDIHLSGRQPHEEHYASIGERPIVPGTYRLQPHWRQDYLALTRAACLSFNREPTASA